MKTKAICSFFVLFAIAAVMVSSTPAAFADHSEVTITPDPGSGDPTDDCIDVEHGCYIPGTATVDVGGKVIFTNDDSKSHTFTAGTAGDGPTKVFGMDLLPPGDSFEWTPDTAGEYPYFCMIHPWMDGLIIVQEAEAAEEEHMEETPEVVEETPEVVEETPEVVEETPEVVEEVPVPTADGEGGGCLIATATFGSELA
ncbi:MAG: hypothetical protein ACE5DT_06565, partial [Nitrosopumilus sp.]